MLVVDIMTTPVLTVTMDTPLDAVARAMLDHGIGAVPVVDEHGKLCGIITEADFTGKKAAIPFTVYRAPQVMGQWLPKEHVEGIIAHAKRITAGSVMHTPVVTATEDEPVLAVIERMIHHEITRIPVVRDGIPVGMIARHDLLRMYARAAGE